MIVIEIFSMIIVENLIDRSRELSSIAVDNCSDRSRELERLIKISDS